MTPPPGSRNSSLHLSQQVALGYDVSIPTRSTKCTNVRSTHSLPTLMICFISYLAEKHKSDISSSYLHVPLDESSGQLTTFNTCLACIDGKDFHSVCVYLLRYFNEALDGVKSVVCIVDDVTIYGKSKDEHNTHLSAFLQKCKTSNIKLNNSKFIWVITLVHLDL